MFAKIYIDGIIAVGSMAMLAWRRRGLFRIEIYLIPLDLGRREDIQQKKNYAIIEYFCVKNWENIRCGK